MMAPRTAFTRADFVMGRGEILHGALKQNASGKRQGCYSCEEYKPGRNRYSELLDDDILEKMGDEKNSE